MLGTGQMAKGNRQTANGKGQKAVGNRNLVFAYCLFVGGGTRTGLTTSPSPNAGRGEFPFWECDIAGGR